VNWKRKDLTIGFLLLDKKITINIHCFRYTYCTQSFVWWLYFCLSGATNTEPILLGQSDQYSPVPRLDLMNATESGLYYFYLMTRLRRRPRNRWQDWVKEDGRIVGGEGWQEKVHKREEWKKLLRTARNH